MAYIVVKEGGHDDVPFLSLTEGWSLTSFVGANKFIVSLVAFQCAWCLCSFGKLHLKQDWK
jgi:hypothetical protein